MKISILYFSKSGNTQKMAQAIADGVQSVEGVEAKVFSLEQSENDFVNESQCVIVGTPTYLASMAGEVKMWLDGASKGCNLAGKLGGAFATADYLHGGADLAIQSILGHLMVRGMMVFSGGGSYGKPYIHLGPVALKENLESYREVFTIYGQRMASKAKDLFGK